ncbi:MAG: PIG-L family deacetylase [Acidobacteria bacterium]|nr:PIG-L family deacetylase [Acidobacteriota bacterium]
MLGRHCVIAAAVLAVFALAAIERPLGAQLRPQPVGELPSDVALRLTLRKLGSIGTFMQTTAHPDDEDNALLAMLSHGEGMRTVLVTATRGDGGQNEIGPELFQSLGVLRTEELQAAHRFDGTEQYFTRAIDFGYSFSVEESLQKWGHDEILGDFVRHIRTIRPDVIAGFLCGGEGGGQHHQASALLTVEAFRAAADPARYPEQIRDGLRPWQAGRVFCTDLSTFGARARQTAPTPDLLTVHPAAFDPLLGRTFTELGIEARSMHKCQGTSQLLPLPGAAFARTYRLRDSVIGEPGIAPKTLYDGIDTTLAGLARFTSSPPRPLTEALHKLGAHVTAAQTAAAGGSPDTSIAPLATGLMALRTLRATLGSLALAEISRYEIDLRLARKESQFEQALAIAQGLRLEVLADDGRVASGQPVKLTVIAGNNGRADVRVKSVAIKGFLTDEASGQPATCAGLVKAGAALSCAVETRVGAVPLSTPYWTPRKDAARYDFDPAAPFGAPFRPSPFTATFQFSIGGADVSIGKTVEFRYDDIIAGEKRMELQVVPPYAVAVSPEIAVIPLHAAARTTSTLPASNDPRSRELRVAVINHVKGPATATASVRLPAGWQAAPVTVPIKFAREDEEVTVKFAVTPSAGVQPGEYPVTAAVQGDSGAVSDTGYEVVEYPHIHRRHVVQPASTRLKVIDVRTTPGIRVGYVMGVGDQVPQAIEQLGATVSLISADELAWGDLARYDLVMTGVRAYERRPDLRANNHRLLAYAENGGTVVVQYNKFEFNEAQYGPFPAKVGSGRVTDENAAVEILVPDHPVFSVPNKIGPETWAGWVQERGLYFLGDHDPRYVDLVRSTDPFEYNAGAKTGALVDVRFGKGRWLYLGLGLWRQLPAGTDGAYRLMANILNLGRR